MGLLFSRQNARIEEQDATLSNAYKYPPKSGNIFFATHFIMGGERFESTQPEAYLFGENMDLNFLNRPTPFPYPAPQPNEPTRTLRSLINVRKESLRFIRLPEGSSYNIEFTFDSDVRCAITIYYFCTEEVTSNAVVYTPKDPSMNSQTYHYKRGVNQQFSQTSHIFDPCKYSEDMLQYKYEDEIIPVLIHCVAEEGEEQSHMVLAYVEKNADDTYALKPLKQKLFVDGLCYLLQEIYGIENKNVSKVEEEEVEDCGSECVICMTDGRDTLILPCRHLCLCFNCADSLRYQASNCPICRAPFRALLQIRAVRRSPHITAAAAETEPSQDIPPNYEAVSLIEALNGPAAAQPPSFVPAPPFSNSPDVLDRHSGSAASLGVPEIVVAAGEQQQPQPPLSLTRGGGGRRKGTSSAPEKMRLLANSIQILNESGKNHRKGDAAETRSLLLEEARRPCGMSLSTPHSLHLCESKDTSPGDSDYFTPEDPNTTLLVDRSTDTSLDTPKRPPADSSSADSFGSTRLLLRTTTPYDHQLMPE